MATCNKIYHVYCFQVHLHRSAAMVPTHHPSAEGPVSLFHRYPWVHDHACSKNCGFLSSFLFFLVTTGFPPSNSVTVSITGFKFQMRVPLGKVAPFSVELASPFQQRSDAGLSPAVLLTLGLSQLRCGSSLSGVLSGHPHASRLLQRGLLWEPLSFFQMVF